jgi:hypothetical protein
MSYCETHIQNAMISNEYQVEYIQGRLDFNTNVEIIINTSCQPIYHTNNNGA